MKKSIEYISKGFIFSKSKRTESPMKEGLVGIESREQCPVRRRQPLGKISFRRERMKYIEEEDPDHLFFRCRFALK